MQRKIMIRTPSVQIAFKETFSYSEIKKNGNLIKINISTHALRYCDTAHKRTHLNPMHISREKIRILNC